MTEGEDGGYVHEPTEFDHREASAEHDGSEADGAARREESPHPAAGTPQTADREFGRRGWILVGVIAFAFVICPLAILLRPPGTGYLFTLLILPLAPAVLLAITAVWATTRP